MPVRPILALALAAALAAPAGAVTYQPYHLLGTGYRDHVDRGRWKVWANGRDLEDGRALALYRAAELADAAGIAALRIVDQGILVMRRRSSYDTVGEVAHFTVLPVRAPADLSACETKPERCLTLSTAKIMATYGPRLAMPTIPHTPGLAAAGLAYDAPVDRETAALIRALALRGLPAPATPASPPVLLPLGTVAAASAAPARAAPPVASDPYRAAREAAIAARRAAGEAVD